MNQVLTEARCSRHVVKHMAFYMVLRSRTQVISLVQQLLHHPSHACSPLLQLFLHNTDPYIACHRWESAWQHSASYVRWTWVKGSQYRRLLVPLAYPEHSGFWGLKRSIEKTCLWCGWDIRNTQYLETYNHVLLKLIFCISSPLSHTFSSFRKMWLVTQEDGGKCWLVNDLWPSQTMPGLISHCQISSNSRFTVSTLTEYNDLERDWPLLAKFTHELFLF